MIRIRLEPTNPRFAVVFEAEREWLHQYLGIDVRVEHVGSTAVPGMLCKPIVDIAVLLSAGRTLDQAASMIRTEHRYVQLVTPHRDPNRFYYVLLRECETNRFYSDVIEKSDWEDSPPLDDRLAHIQIFLYGSSAFASLVRMRNVLRNSAEARTLYSAHKQTLARRWWPNSRAYALAKDEVIERILHSDGLA